MDRKTLIAVSAAGAVLALGFAACAKTDGGDRSSKVAESTVTTNDNGSVSRVFSESTVTTNGNMVTEHRRETRTSTDMDGNVLATTTSEYAQSYPVGDVSAVPLSATLAGAGDGDGAEAPAANSDSFLGLKFGESFESTNLVQAADEPDFLRTTFRPAKGLDGFDDFYVYVTPKTHRIAKVYACAKDAVEPGSRWRRHYLIEALEKRYGTWARLCSWSRPCYAFDVGGGRHVTACLDGASADYRTVIAAWDDALLVEASEEYEQIREEARKTAAEKRRGRVKAAADAF